MPVIAAEVDSYCSKCSPGESKGNSFLRRMRVRRRVSAVGKKASVHGLALCTKLQLPIWSSASTTRSPTGRSSPQNGQVDGL